MRTEVTAIHQNTAPFPVVKIFSEKIKHTIHTIQQALLESEGSLGAYGLPPVTMQAI